MLFAAFRKPPLSKLFRKPDMRVKLLTFLKRVGYYFSKSQADDWLSAELRFPVLFEVPPELEILMGLPVKSSELLSVFKGKARIKKHFS